MLSLQELIKFAFSRERRNDSFGKMDTNVK